MAYYVVPTKYEATVLLYVNNSSISVGSTSISLSDLSASQTLVDAYIAILNTRLTLNDVIAQAGVDYTFEEMKQLVHAEAVNGTEIFQVRDPEEAERVANTIVKVLPDKIARIVDGPSVRAVDLAVVPEKKSSPSYTVFTAMGALVGLLLSGGETRRIAGITSSLSGEGKSTTALNLAYVLAESGKRALAVEGDMRLPTISRRLGPETKEGLSNLLAGLCEV